MRPFYLSTLVLLFAIVTSPFVLAQDEPAATEQAAFPATAHATLEFVSNNLLETIETAKEQFDEDPNAYYAEIDAIMSPWLDYDRWAKAVMGRQFYPDATEEQRKNFAAVFQRSLVQTYAKGLLNVENSGFEIEPPHPGDDDKSSVSVRQTLFAGADRVKVQYSMAKNDEGRWQLRNVVLEGINLGQTFRNQFKRAAEEYEYDLDKVIANWSPEA